MAAYVIIDSTRIDLVTFTINNRPCEVILCPSVQAYTGADFYNVIDATPSFYSCYVGFVNGRGYTDEIQYRLARNEAKNRASWFIPRSEWPGHRLISAPTRKLRTIFSRRQRCANKRRNYIQKLRRSNGIENRKSH